MTSFDVQSDKMTCRIGNTADQECAGKHAFYQTKNEHDLDRSRIKARFLNGFKAKVALPNAHSASQGVQSKIILESEI